MNGIYQLAVLGDVQTSTLKTLQATLKDLIEDFDLHLGHEVMLFTRTDLAARDRKSAFAALYFVGATAKDEKELKSILADAVPVIPILKDPDDIIQAPASVQNSNGLLIEPDDTKMVRVATALLECVGLLRQQRRVFVSYRRKEASSAAVQVHDDLISRGFDVFLDIHKVRPGDPFQDILWNRLCNCDVLVMLDTPQYFDSRWTRAEIGRARAKGIQVLRVVWPGHTPTKMTDLAETIYLDTSELLSSQGPVIPQVEEQIALAVEQLRSRSIAARFLSITGKLKANVESIGAKFGGVGAYRASTIELVDGSIVRAYPVVGVPSAELLNDIAVRAGTIRDNEHPPVLVYDHIGIRQRWKDHLNWLNSEIGAVDLLKVDEAGWELADWEPRS